ncbi:hypothetical protein D3C81_558100 [compost metagenome]
MGDNLGIGSAAEGREVSFKQSRGRVGRGRRGFIGGAQRLQAVEQQGRGGFLIDHYTAHGRFAPATAAQRSEQGLISDRRAAVGEAPYQFGRVPCQGLFVLKQPRRLAIAKQTR